MLLVMDLSAQNPIVAAGIYFADPAAHVWEDDVAAYKYVTIRLAPDTDPGKIMLKLGNFMGTKYRTRGGDTTRQSISADMDIVTGVQARWLKFTGEGKDLFTIDWIQFN